MSEVKINRRALRHYIEASTPTEAWSADQILHYANAWAALHDWQEPRVRIPLLPTQAASWMDILNYKNDEALRLTYAEIDLDRQSIVSMRVRQGASFPAARGQGGGS